jgi:GNAT superfamily N-acetyltransferase
LRFVWRNLARSIWWGSWLSGSLLCLAPFLLILLIGDRRLGRSYIPLYNQRKGFSEARFADSHYGRELRFPLKRQRQPEVFAVALLRGVIVGAVDYHADYQDGKPGFAKLAVDPAVRTRGIATILVRWCTQRAKDQGHSVILLHTTSAMHAAQRLYTRLGFVQQPLEEDELLRPLFLFQLDLSPSFPLAKSVATNRQPLEVLYRDEWYAVVNKPSGTHASCPLSIEILLIGDTHASCRLGRPHDTPLHRIRVSSVSKHTN